MKTLQNIRPLACLMIICAIAFSAPQVSAQELTDYTEFKGKVVDAATDRGLTSASIVVEGSNIGTITNDEGEFLLKVPAKDANGTLLVSILGYTVNKVAIANLLSEGNLIKLSPKITELTEVNVSTYTDPEKLVRQVFKRKVENNGDTDLKMTAFYRETIKKRNRNVSLTEAVVNLHKKPYASTERDVIELHKARKSTDYKRMDTVALKLQGGPFSTLYLDIMKYPEYIFTEASIPNYIFTFDSPTAINGKPVYVVHFIDRNSIAEPHYEGKLYIDSENLALTSASYRLNVGNKRAASKIFVQKKPRDVNVYPTQARYKVDYREKNGKWYYGYGRVDLSFKVNKRRKLFNTVYSLSSEMAVTDITDTSPGQFIQNKMKPTVVMADAVSGFSDPDFWGPYNVIEPEKSIESAISKIQRKMQRNN